MPIEKIIGGRPKLASKIVGRDKLGFDHDAASGWIKVGGVKHQVFRRYGTPFPDNWVHLTEAMTADQLRYGSLLPHLTHGNPFLGGASPELAESFSGSDSHGTSPYTSPSIGNVSNVGLGWWVWFPNGQTVKPNSHGHTANHAHVAVASTAANMLYKSVIPITCPLAFPGTLFFSEVNIVNLLFEREWAAAAATHYHLRMVDTPTIGSDSVGVLHGANNTNLTTYVYSATTNDERGNPYTFYRSHFHSWSHTHTESEPAPQAIALLPYTSGETLGIDSMEPGMIGFLTTPDVPDGFVAYTNLYTRLVRAIASGLDTPGSVAGSNLHTHYNRKALLTGNAVWSSSGYTGGLSNPPDYGTSGSGHAAATHNHASDILDPFRLNLYPVIKE